MTYSFVIVESSPSLEHCTKSVITLIVEWGRVGQRLHYSYKFSFLQRENLLISSDSKAYSIIFYPNLKNIKVETPYNDILSTNGLNTLIFNNPYAKLCFITMLTSQYRKIIYIDLDTTFTAYVKAGLLLENTKN